LRLNNFFIIIFRQSIMGGCCCSLPSNVPEPAQQGAFSDFLKAKEEPNHSHAYTSESNSFGSTPLKSKCQHGDGNRSISNEKPTNSLKTMILNMQITEEPTPTPNHSPMILSSHQHCRDDNNKSNNNPNKLNNNSETYNINTKYDTKITFIDDNTNENVNTKNEDNNKNSDRNVHKPQYEQKSEIYTNNNIDVSNDFNNDHSNHVENKIDNMNHAHQESNGSVRHKGNVPDTHQKLACEQNCDPALQLLNSDNNDNSDEEDEQTMTETLKMQIQELQAAIERQRQIELNAEKENALEEARKMKEEEEKNEELKKQRLKYEESKRLKRGERRRMQQQKKIRV